MLFNKLNLLRLPGGEPFAQIKKVEGNEGNNACWDRWRSL